MVCVYSLGLRNYSFDLVEAYRYFLPNSSFFVNPIQATFMGAIFTPSGVYLLWQHIGWETMFVYGTEDLHGLAVCLFASSNVVLGVLGYYVCGRLVKADHYNLAHAVWTSAYVATFGIASVGYDRALYPGIHNVYHNHLSFFTALGLGAYRRGILCLYSIDSRSALKS